MLGGVGEAMLIGAAVGGGSAALTGGDPLKGALIGAATGGVGSGITGLAAGSGGLSGLLGSGATTAETALAPELVNAGAQASGAAAGATPTGIPGIIQGVGFTGSTTPSVATNILGGDPLALAKLGAAEAPAFGSSFDLMAKTPEAAANLYSSPLVSPTTSTFSSGLGNAGPTGISSFVESAAAKAPSTTPSLFTDPLGYVKANKVGLAGIGLAGALGGRQPIEPIDTAYRGPLSRFRYNPESYVPGGGSEAARRKRFGFADGGIAALPGYDKMVGETPLYPRAMASGGVSDLGSYSDGGRMLRGAGDGMSDSIPGVIAGKQPARLADSEFVVPADVVSHLGNGSTDAGAKQLYKMMDRVRMARTGTKKQGKQINPMKYLPA